MGRHALNWVPGVSFHSSYIYLESLSVIFYFLKRATCLLIDWD